MYRVVFDGVNQVARILATEELHTIQRPRSLGLECHSRRVHLGTAASLNELPQDLLQLGFVDVYVERWACIQRVIE